MWHTCGGGEIVRWLVEERLLDRPKSRWKEDIKMHLQKQREGSRDLIKSFLMTLMPEILFFQALNIQSFPCVCVCVYVCMLTANYLHCRL
jgi:hypothetical protein